MEVRVDPQTAQLNEIIVDAQTIMRIWDGSTSFIDYLLQLARNTQSNGGLQDNHRIALKAALVGHNMGMSSVACFTSSGTPESLERTLNNFTYSQPYPFQMFFQAISPQL
jgi:hypothetical protein